MYNISYFFIKVKYIFSGRKKEVINDFFRKKGVKIGGGMQYMLQYFNSRIFFN